MRQAKGKISISLPMDLLDDIDRGVEAKLFASRSALVEASLRRWARQRRDAEIEAYYAALSPPERAEDEAWAALGAETFAASAAREEQAQAASLRSHVRRRTRRKAR